MEKYTLSPEQAKNRIEVKDSQLYIDPDYLNLNYKKQYDLQDWQPETEIKPYEELVKLYIDIECTGLDKEIERVLYVGLMLDYKGETEVHIIKDRDEKDLLLALNKFLHSEYFDVLIGHNVFNYDIPFLVRRYQEYNLNTPLVRHSENHVTRVTSSSLFGKPMELVQCSCRVKGVRIPIVDTMVLAAIYEKSAAKLNSFSLKDIAISVGGREEKRYNMFEDVDKETGLTGVKLMIHLWNHGEEDKIIKYLKYDLDDTKILSDFFLPVYHYQSMVVPYMDLQLICLSSPAKKWNNIAKSFYDEEYIASIKPDEKNGYIGAITDATPGLYVDTFKLDVSSMYPSIIMTYELAGRKDKDKHLLRVMKYLTEERLRLKQLYKETKNPEYNQQQNAMKILINGGYGFFGTGGYEFNDMRTATLVTVYGRALIKLMVDVIEKHGFIIIEVDTDGIICGTNDYYNKWHDSDYDGEYLSPHQLCDVVNEALPEGIEVGVDWDNSDVYVHKRKSYIIFDNENGSPKSVGLFRKRDRNKLETEVPVEVINIMKNLPYRDNTAAYSNDIKEQVINGYWANLRSKIESHEYPLENLVITKKISKSDVTLTSLGIGEKGDKVTIFFSEEERYGKPRKDGTQKKLKSHKKPVKYTPNSKNDEYWADYYIEKLNEIISDLLPF